MSMRIFTLSAALLALAAPAGAQQFGDWMKQRPAYDDSQRPYYDARRVAYDNGYREGLERGQKAARDRKAFDLEREKEFRKADEGYSRSYGDKDRYRDNFRRGFADGYREAYTRYGYNGYGGYGGYGNGRAIPRNDRGWNYPPQYPRYPNSYPGYGYGYGSAAFQNGVNDGYQKGREDARDGKYPDYARQRWYRSGDRHYDSRYGPRDVYKNEYRRGFQQGYERAYREGRW